MKILLISAFPPDPAPEANHALHISEQLAQAGHTVHVLCKAGSIAALHSGIVVHADIRDWSWRDLPRVLRCLREIRPDVVLLLYISWVYHHHPMITFLPTLCQTLRPRVPCVTQFEIVDAGVPTGPFTTRVIRKIAKLWVGRRGVDWQFGTLLRDSARLIVLSSPHRDRLRQHDADVDDKCAIVPPPPLMRVCPDSPAAVRQRVRRRIGVADEDFVFVYWGYLYPGKGVETLLRAFRQLCSHDRTVRLLVVGGKLEITGRRQSCADYFDQVRTLPEELGIADRVTWTGHFNWDDDAGSQYLYASDVCVLPYDYGVTLNNSSLAAASAHGVPVIATELPAGQDEGLEHGQNIFLCRPRDPDMLAEAMQVLRDDPPVRERLRAGARKLAQTWYRWDTTTPRLVQILDAAVTDGKGSIPHLARHKADHSHLASPLLPQSDTNDVAPLVSVIVAAYNVEKYLSQCLDSLVNQTLQDIEIIVVNDGSTDRTAEVADDYASIYDNVKVISCCTNTGLASARNLGMRTATGRYIAFTDGDDWADIRMCEVLYRRAEEVEADVVIAHATVFFDDHKTFGPLWDQPIWQTFDPRLKQSPFKVQSEPRVLLLELVAWTKLYRRSFLEQHTLHFEDGMNSYEDICFHFSALLKAARISLLDEAVLFYRKNRPGQISGRTNRKIFEVFAVFQKIHDNLTAWSVPPEIWAMLVKVQLRVLEWLIKDRLQPQHRREFLEAVARQFRLIPASGFRLFAQQADTDEWLKAHSMRQNRLHVYVFAVQHRDIAFPLLNLMRQEGWGSILKQAWQKAFKRLPRLIRAAVRCSISKSWPVRHLEHRLKSLNESFHMLTRGQDFAVQSCKLPVVEACRINNVQLLLSRPDLSDLGDAIWQAEHDYYLTQTAVFRPGDTVI